MLRGSIRWIFRIFVPASPKASLHGQIVGSKHAGCW